MSDAVQAIEALLAEVVDDALAAAASDQAWHRRIVTRVLGTGKRGAHHQAAHIARWDPERVLARTHRMRVLVALLEDLAVTRPLTARMIAQLLTDNTPTPDPTHVKAEP